MTHNVFVIIVAPHVRQPRQEARTQLDMFNSYKPDVNIVYYDEYGRSLTPKEAWKALSHKFHGKGCGKMNYVHFTREWIHITPAMKPGFSRISSAADTPTQTGTPVPSERTKVAFGFESKRKAADDFMGPPPSKRR